MFNKKRCFFMFWVTISATHTLCVHSIAYTQRRGVNTANVSMKQAQNVWHFTNNHLLCDTKNNTLQIGCALNGPSKHTPNTFNLRLLSAFGVSSRLPSIAGLPCLDVEPVSQVAIALNCKDSAEPLAFRIAANALYIGYTHFLESVCV